MLLLPMKLIRVTSTFYLQVVCMLLVRATSLPRFSRLQISHIVFTTSDARMLMATLENYT